MTPALPCVILGTSTLGGSELCGASLNHKKEDHMGFSKWPLTCERPWPWSREDCVGKEQGSDVPGAEREVERKRSEREMLGLGGSVQMRQAVP